MQHSLIQKLMLYKFELIPNAIEATKNIFYVKGDGTVVITVQEILFELQESQ